MTPVQEPNSRRNFLEISAKLAAAGMSAMAVNAQTTTPAANDIAVLTYLLSLQHVEVAFYGQGIIKFKPADFAESSMLTPLGAGIAAEAHNLMRVIADQERSHVGALQSTLRALRGPAVSACTYDFKFQTVEDFIRSAQSLESLAAQSHVGAMALLATPAIRTILAGIAVVEGRHASYINLLSGTLPFPGPADDTRSAAQVEAGIKDFISSCPSSGPPASKTVAVLNPKNLVTAQYEILLDATASTAGDKGALKFLTRHAPGGKIASIYEAETGMPRVQFGEGSGTYNFELTVTDSGGATATDTTSINYIGR